MLTIDGIPAYIADDDLFDYLYDHKTMEMDEFIVEYLDWEKENLTFFSRLKEKVRRLS